MVLRLAHHAAVMKKEKRGHPPLLPQRSDIAGHMPARKKQWKSFLDKIDRLGD